MCLYEKVLPVWTQFTALRERFNIKMDVSKLEHIRTIFQILAFGIFLFQLQGSVKRYLEGPVIQEKSSIPLKSISQPKFIVCRENKFNYTLSEKTFGYEFVYTLLAGKMKGKNSISWQGKDGNVPYEDIKRILYGEQIRSLRTENNPFKSVFSPVRGNCIEIMWKKDTVREVICNTENVYLLVVDPLRMYDISYIEMENARVSVGPSYGNFFEYATYEMLFSVYDTSIKDGVTCTDYEKINSTYGECVNEVVKDMFIKNIDCVPPWVPSNFDSVCEIDKAVQVKDTTDYEILTSDLIEMSSGLEMDIFQTCLPPCRSMKVLMKRVDHGSQLNKSWLVLKANKDVTVYTEMYEYNGLSLVVDLGSAMGLWLGVSALTVLDYILQLFSFMEMKLFK